MAPVAEVLVPAAHVVGAPQGNPELPQQGRIPAPQQRTPSWYVPGRNGARRRAGTGQGNDAGATGNHR